MKRLLLVPAVALVFAGCEKPTEPNNTAVSPAVQASNTTGGYKAIDLNIAVDGYDRGGANDTNNRGQVVGWSRKEPEHEWHAVLWEDGGYAPPPTRSAILHALKPQDVAKGGHQGRWTGSRRM